MNASTGELEIAAKSCERWAWFCGGFVVLGLIAEIVLAVCHPPYDSFWEVWGTSVATALIALGVGGEILFARMGFSRQEEIRRRSDQEVSQARLETERLRAQFGWRAITPEQRRALVEELSKTPALVAIWFVQGDAESASYVQQFTSAFREARWGVTINAAIYALVEFTIRAPELTGDKAAPSQALRAALTLASIPFEGAPTPRMSAWTAWNFPPAIPATVTGTLYWAGSAELYIGPKNMPWAIGDAAAQTGTAISAPPK